MNDILQPPADRDLSADRADRIRAGVLAKLDEPSHTGRRVAVLAAVVTTVAAAGVGGAALWPSGGDGGSTQALAMSVDELSPSLRSAVKQCQSWSSETPPLDDLTVAAQHGHSAAMLFLTGTGYFTCDVVREPRKEVTGSTGSDEWGDRRNWLPGPVQWLSLTSSDKDGGDVIVIGRASARVKRLVLEHGGGRSTTARLKDGTFGLVSARSPVRANARLVSYDAAGNEIGRMPLFDRIYPDRCYADPTGKVLYMPRGTPKDAPRPDPATCLPTEAWGR